jgi:hypothetical protein
MLELGSSRPWPEAMEQITGQREMDASAIVEYFAPLYEWLKAENAKTGELIGWKDAGELSVLLENTLNTHSLILHITLMDFRIISPSSPQSDPFKRQNISRTFEIQISLFSSPQMSQRVSLPLPENIIHMTSREGTPFPFKLSLLLLKYYNISISLEIKKRARFGIGVHLFTLFWFF